MTAINRRRALTGSAAIAVGVPVLAACGSDDEPTATDASSSAPSPSDDSPSESSSDGEIPCPCHGSRFSLEDGSPVSGPATSALSPVEITVDGDSITEA